MTDETKLVWHKLIIGIAVLAVGALGLDKMLVDTVCPELSCPDCEKVCEVVD